MSIDHALRAEYTRHDDGIWIVCTCGFRENLGYWSTLTELKAVETRHVAYCYGGDKT